MDEHKHEKNETITLKKDTLWKVLAVIFAGLFLLAIFGVFGGKSSSNNAIPTGADDLGGVTGKIKVEIESNDPVSGDANAEVSIVEFSDFQCPFCARAHDDTLTGFRASNYFKNGEVNLIYKQFPLNSIHPYAQNAGEASLCAHDQGKFWEYHNVLFANQQALDDLSLKAHAQTIGLDVDAFSNCLDSNDKKSEVDKETKQATDAGGRGTPYFVVINNKNGNTASVSGAVPFAQLEAAINAVQ